MTTNIASQRDRKRKRQPPRPTRRSTPRTVGASVAGGVTEAGWGGVAGVPFSASGSPGERSPSGMLLNLLNRRTKLKIGKMCRLY